VLVEEAADAHQRARRTEACHHVGDARQVLQDLRRRAFVVGERVRRVAVLVEHHPVRVLLGELLGYPHRLVGPTGGRRRHDLGTPHAQQLPSLLGRVLGHDADQPVALELGRHGERDPGVARRRLEDRDTRPKDALLLGLLDHPQRRAILDRARRVTVFELRPQPYVWRRRKARQADQRSLADGIE